jgi:VanZ family protein
MNYKMSFKYWFPVILWVSFTFWMSTGAFAASATSGIIEPLLRYLMPHLSETEVKLIHGVIRKLAHLTEYFILGLLLFRAFRSDSAVLKTWRWAFYSLLAVVLFAAGDEFHQSFVGTRTASIIDVGIDTLGGFLAQCTMLLWNGLRRNRT